MSNTTKIKSALQNLLDMYLSGANSGDWGYWDPEKESEVIAAREALSEKDEMEYCYHYNILRERIHTDGTLFSTRPLTDMIEIRKMIAESKFEHTDFTVLSFTCLKWPSMEVSK